MAESPQEIALYFLLPPQLLLLDVAGPAEVFYFANRYQQQVHFSLHFIAPEAWVQSAVGLPLAASPLPESLPEGAILLLPGMSGEEPEWQFPANQALLAWLSAQGQRCRHLVTICAGALLAARAGLLADHRCTTHHSHCQQLGRMAPAARVEENCLYVADGWLWSSAGVTSGIDLALSLLEKLTSAPCAARVARNMVVYLRRNGAQSQFSPWLSWRNHLHPAIHRVQDALILDPLRAWDLASVAQIACVTPRHLTRLFRQQTGITLMDYLGELRLAVAEPLLREQYSVEEVAGRIGLSGASQLRRLWQRLRQEPLSYWRERHVVKA